MATKSDVTPTPPDAAALADCERASELLAACVWGNTPPPWKAESFTSTPPDLPTLHYVTNDAGDPHDEYDVFESPDRTVVEFAAACPTLLPRLEAHCRRLLAENERLRAAIRTHRDQRGDDRCWLDDGTLYAVLPEGYTPPARSESVELELCKRYIATRHNPGTEYVSPQRRVEELEAALRPFAAIYDSATLSGRRTNVPSDSAALGLDEDDTLPVELLTDATFGDCRRAAALLAGKDGGR